MVAFYKMDYKSHQYYNLEESTILGGNNHLDYELKVLFVENSINSI